MSKKRNWKKNSLLSLLCHAIFPYWVLNSKAILDYDKVWQVESVVSRSIVWVRVSYTSIDDMKLQCNGLITVWIGTGYPPDNNMTHSRTARRPQLGVTRLLVYYVLIPLLRLWLLITCIQQGRPANWNMYKYRVHSTWYIVNILKSCEVSEQATRSKSQIINTFMMSPWTLKA